MHTNDRETNITINMARYQSILRLFLLVVLALIAISHGEESEGGAAAAAVDADDAAADAAAEAAAAARAKARREFDDRAVIRTTLATYDWLLARSGFALATAS